MALPKVKCKRGKGGSNGGRGRSEKTEDMKIAGKKHDRREARQQEKESD